MPTDSPSSFVARQEELARVARLLEDGRLVTIWGTAGIGKSRLAEELARSSPRPAHMIRLAEISSAEGVSAAIARTAGDAPMSARTGADLARQTGRRLRSLGPTLLILDGFDHLVANAGAVLTPVLEEAPELAVLVTSRERLRLPDERAFELGPLAVADAARLFEARAGLAGEAAGWMDRLDGIPLAIELAAASLHGSGPPSAPLAERLALAASRHATMRAAIAWSWDRLSEVEQRALSGCAVFRASFSLASAEQVLDLEPAHERAPTVVALREKSLLTVRDEGGPSPRFALFDAVREFVLEQLVAAPERRAALLERHDAWFTRRGRELAGRVERTGDIHARDALAREIEGLLDVHERALESAPADPSMRERAIDALLAADVVLATRWSAHKRLELWRRAHAVVCVRETAAAAPTGARLGRTCARLGQALAAVGELEEAARLIREGLAMLEGDEDARSELYLDLGVVHHARRDFAEARAAYVTALGDGRAPRDKRTMARVAGNLGALHHDEGRMDAARRSYEKSVELASSVGDARIEGIMWANLAVLDQEEGDRAGALARYERALALLGQAKDQRLLAITRSNRGLVHLERGALEEALTDHREALAMLRPIAETRSEGLAMVRLAVTSSLSGRAEDAEHLLGEATGAFERGADAVGLEAARVAAGFLDLARGDRPGASARLAAASAARADDAKTLARILGAALAAPPEPAVEARDALVVAPDGAAFRPPRGGWVSTSNNDGARRVLEAITRCNEVDPHAGVGAAALIEAAFPGELLDPKLGRSRLYAAISWLRSRGLEAVLLRRPEGYCFDPAVRLLRGSPPETLAGGATSGLAGPAKTGRRR